MILGYSSRNAINPKATAEHIAKFQQLAMKQDPSLAAKMPLYHKVAGELASRIEGLDPDRRRLAHEDLNQNILHHVSQALTTGQTQPAVKAIREHVIRLAQKHGVALPPGAGAPTPAPASPQAQPRA